MIVLSWNTSKKTVECIKSIYQNQYENYDLIVVDNNSTDDTIVDIKEFCRANHISTVELSENEIFRKKVHPLKLDKEILTLYLIKNCANYGFARGNNIGIKFSLHSLQPKYILLLNSDVVVERSFLNLLIDFALKDEKIGALQPLILNSSGELIDSLGQEMLLLSGRDKGNGQLYRKISNKSIEIFGPCAAAALYRSRVLREIGLLDEDFFIIYEDLDLSWRIQLAGYKSVLIPNSIVYHNRGISGKTLNNRKKIFKPSLKTYHANKNWINIILRYYPMQYILYVLLKSPKQFFQPIFLSLYYVWRQNQWAQFIKFVQSSIQKRRKNNKNRLFKVVQLQWIKKEF